MSQQHNETKQIIGCGSIIVSVIIGIAAGQIFGTSEGWLAGGVALLLIIISTR